MKRYSPRRSGERPSSPSSGMGPMLAATRTSRPSAARRAIATPARRMRAASSREQPRPRLLAPKVLVRRRRAPASRYSVWMPWISSGRSRFARSTALLSSPVSWAK